MVATSPFLEFSIEIERQLVYVSLEAKISSALLCTSRESDGATKP